MKLYSPTLTKRFWVFRYEWYESIGGMRDFVDSFDTLEEAVQNEEKFLNENSRDSFGSHILDTQEKKISWTSDENMEDFFPEFMR